MDTISVLANRTMSAFPLSIGTSLAFESLYEGRQTPYDISRAIPNKININDYEVFLINIDTLVRNILGAIPTVEAELLSPQALLMALEEEINTIIDINTNEGQSHLQLYFYSRNYIIIENNYNKKFVKIINPNTHKQKIHAGQIHDTVKLIVKNKQYNYIHAGVGLTLYPKGLSSALILTHVPYDLLSGDLFKKLNLLESHTGILKTKKEFWSKYYDSKKLELNNIPFQKRLLGIFGDHVLIRPMPIGIRRAIMELADKHKWTSVTTTEKVRHDISTYMPDLGIRLMYNTIVKV